MKRISYIIAAISGLFLLGSCYDDSQVREEIAKVETELSGYEKTVADVQAQVNNLNSIKSSSFITYLNKNEKGNYVITYMNNGGDTHTVELAVDEDVINQPLISTKEEDGKLYWVTTDNKGGNVQFITDADGKKMLVGGTAPTITIDDNGYWAVGDSPLLGLDGKPVLATDVSNILFTKIDYFREIFHCDVIDSPAVIRPCKFSAKIISKRKRIYRMITFMSIICTVRKEECKILLSEIHT